MWFNLCEHKFGCKIPGSKVAEKSINNSGSLNLHSTLQKTKSISQGIKYMLIKPVKVVLKVKIQTQRKLQLTSKTCKLLGKESVPLCMKMERLGRCNKSVGEIQLLLL